MKSNRIKLHFLQEMNIDNEEPQLIINEDNFLLKKSENENITISFNEIEKIKISLVNRIYNPSIGILKDGFKGFMSHRNSGQFSIYFNYYIDLDIYTKMNSYFFESSDLEDASKFVLNLNNKFNIDDELDLLNLFKSKSYNEAKDYIDKNYKNWAKKFHLENPRTTLDTNMTDLAEKKLKK